MMLATKKSVKCDGSHKIQIRGFLQRICMIMPIAFSEIVISNRISTFQVYYKPATV